MSLKSLEIGATLSRRSFCDRRLLENAGRVKAYGRQEREDMEEDSLTPLFQGIEPLTPVSNEIYRCILSEEEISDDASPGLKHVRRSMAVTTDRIHSQLSGMVNGSLHSYLQDALITSRNGRYCIPVKAEYRSQVPGMIHDQSSTGSTLFIEPAAVVNLNNQMRELEIKEQEEIEKVLAALSARLPTTQRILRKTRKSLRAWTLFLPRHPLPWSRTPRSLYLTTNTLLISGGRDIPSWIRKPRCPSTSAWEGL